MIDQLPSFEQMDAISRVAEDHGVNPLTVEFYRPAHLPAGWLSIKVAGQYYTCSPSGDVRP